MEFLPVNVLDTRIKTLKTFWEFSPEKFRFIDLENIYSKFYWRLDCYIVWIKAQIFSLIPSASFSKALFQLMPMSVLILTPALITQLELHGDCLVSVERLIVKLAEKMFTFRMHCKLVKQHIFLSLCAQLLQLWVCLCRVSLLLDCRRWTSLPLLLSEIFLPNRFGHFNQWNRYWWVEMQKITPSNPIQQFTKAKHYLVFCILSVHCYFR